MAKFRRGVERGELGALFDGTLREVMAEAAAERGFGQEVGALRVAMARLLAEEEDAGNLALGVARVAQAVARVAQAVARVGREQRAAAAAGELDPNPEGG